MKDWSVVPGTILREIHIVGERFMLSKRLLSGQVTEERASMLSILFAVFCILFFGAANFGCKGNEAKNVEERVMNVKVWNAENQSLRPFIETIGTLKPYEEVILSSEVDGIVKIIRVVEGSWVSKGMVVAEINETDYRLEVQKSQAALRQSEASLANAKLEFERKAALYKEELVTKQQYDDISARLAVAEGDLDRAKATLELAREKLAKTKIYSPLRGLVKEKKVNVGDYVRNGTPLLWIIQSDPIKLSFTVPEKEVRKLRAGQDVSLKVDTYPGKEFKGRVSTIYPSLDERTRSLQVEALVPNHDNSLKPGLFAKVTLYTGEAKDVVVVPVTAILYDNTKIKIFVAEGDRARERLVKVGSKYGEYMEITEGLQKGEMVVVVGQNNLSEGVKIHVAR
jgi:membrane fusion protein (multidrug efflux system)